LQVQFIKNILVRQVRIQDN